jgi:predicted ATPase/class 3 adenylate cyclase
MKNAIVSDSAVHELAGVPAVAPAHASEADTQRANRYVPRILQQHLVDEPQSRAWVADGTAAFVDISGFTQLSERLARKGRVGAEQITDAIGESFESILQVAYDNGGSLLKFGGDSLLLWFQDEAHAMRGCRATVLMRRALRGAGRIELPGAKVTLRMAQAVHSGRFDFFAVGTSHLELLPTGPAWSRLIAMEQEASAGEILVSPELAALLPDRCLGEVKEPGRFLRREPPGYAEKIPLKPRPRMPVEMVAHCLPPAIRAHVFEGGGTPEHRPVTIAFLRFDGTDALIRQNGPTATAELIHHLVSTVEAVAEEQGVSFLASDVDVNGGKLILTAGAPKVTGDDEERMLIALRKIADTALPIPIRIGVHRGSAFAGDIGPAYRRTYTVMGDAVNLSARLMTQAKPGLIYATADVLDRSNTMFETTELEPFKVKGKLRSVQAWAVGRAKGSRTRQAMLKRLPMIGRDAEFALLRDALAGARSGAGRLIEVVGETGVGKTRLLQDLREKATDFHHQHAVCEAYTVSTPYAVWRELLREFMHFGRDESDTVVLERLRAVVESKVPDLAPWMPLLAIAFDFEVGPTPEVEMLAETNRRAKLHETIGRFLEVVMPDRELIEIENAHHMDPASAELLSYLAGQLENRPWVFGVARRPSNGGFTAPDAASIARIALEPLSPKDTLRLTQLATEDHPLPMHVLQAASERSGGNPQFLRDLLRVVIESGSAGGLPDSAEAAAMARIDALAPQDRSLVRRAAVFGLTFHPRMLSWVADESDALMTGPATWDRLHELFDSEPDGYLRFRRSLLRDAAYEGLPYKLRRRLHAAVATHLSEEGDPEDIGGILSLHYLEAGEYPSAWRYATLAAKRAEGVFANVEAAGLYARALEAGRGIPELSKQQLATVYQDLGDSWYRAGEFQKASEPYTTARGLVGDNALVGAELLLKLSHVEAKLGKYERAKQWAAQGRSSLIALEGQEAAREAARAGAWYAIVLRREGRTAEALEWAERAVAEAESADDPEALADAYSVMGLAHGELGKDGGLQLLQRSLEAYRRAGNQVRQAALLSDLGIVCQWQGRWDEALSYYERAGQENLKVGSTVNATLARLNMAEILTDRGEWVEAEALLLEILPIWKAAKFQYFLAACLSLLGRVSLRTGRFEEALGRLAEARANFLHVGAEAELPPVDARIAECRAAMGNLNVAVKLVRGMLGRSSESNGVARVVPLLERIRAHVLLEQGELRGARVALDASLAAAREQHNLFETALTVLSLIELDRLEGTEPPAEMVNESTSLLATLRIRAVPPIPHAAQ